MIEQELKIEGMNCGHCVMHVKKELIKIPDLQIEDVQIGKAKVKYDENKVSLKDIEAAIDEAGYKLVTV